MKTQQKTRQRKPMLLTEGHVVKGTRIIPPFPEGLETAIFGMGCFWGPERLFWQQESVYSTAVGYIGGEPEHPTYNDVCSDRTGHAEAVLVVFDPEVISYEKLLKIFWKGHRAGTKGRGAVIRHQYRSAIFTATPEQAELALASLQHYQQGLQLREDEEVATEILPATTFYYAEQYHQQYQARR